METTRRIFLRGIITATSALILPPVRQLIPSIWGDGVHDDGPGLNALINGDPVNILADGTRVLDGGLVVIEKGNFLINETLFFKNPYVITTWDDCRIESGKPLDCFMDFSRCAYAHIQKSEFKMIGKK